MSPQSLPPRRTSGYEYGGSASTDPPRIAPDTAYRGAPLPPPPEVKGRGCGGFFGRAFVWGAVIAFVATLCAVCGIFGVYALYAGQLPSADKLATANPDQSTKIYDRKGGLLYEIFDANGGRHTIITPDQIPPVLKQATIATEDPSFYSNVGVDPLGVLRAIYYLVRYQRRHRRRRPPSPSSWSRTRLLYARTDRRTKNQRSDSRGWKSRAATAKTRFSRSTLTRLITATFRTASRRHRNRILKKT